MQQPTSHIRQLWERYLSDTASVAEVRELFDHIAEPARENEHLAITSDILREGPEVISEDPYVREYVWKQIFPSRSSKILTMPGWVRWAVAAIIILGIGTYLWTIQQTTTPALTYTKPVPKENIRVLPGSDKAILTLSDGQQISLDSNANAVLAEKGISNEKALITYSGKDAPNTINTLTTPKGGQYKIRLSDGTMVWLNAASSITYPTNFTGKTRAVSIVGEAYFEVTKNIEKPFIVKAKKEEIIVLGTTFNVNAYDDEEEFKTSLVEGSVKIGHFILHPNEAYVKGKIVETNISQDIAWKNGVFDFNNQSLEQVMKQLSRWYDIEVVYSNGIPDKSFFGKMSRSLGLNDVLEFLKGSKIEFELKEKQLIIKK